MPELTGEFSPDNGNAVDWLFGKICRSNVWFRRRVAPKGPNGRPGIRQLGHSEGGQQSAAQAALRAFGTIDYQVILP
jgi:hypothetical protein